MALQVAVCVAQRYKRSYIVSAKAAGAAGKLGVCRLVFCPSVTSVTVTKLFR